jgi:hypothetical protein
MAEKKCRCHDIQILCDHEVHGRAPRVSANEKITKVSVEFRNNRACRVPVPVPDGSGNRARLGGAAHSPESPFMVTASVLTHESHMSQ